jgi:hypothetical protein
LREDAPPLAAVALLGGSALAYECLLSRLLAIVHWQGAAYAAIGAALLGYGASGGLLALLAARGRPRAEPGRLFAFFAALFALSVPVGFAVSTLFLFPPAEAGWNPWLALALVPSGAALSLPFLFAGSAVGSALASAGSRVSRVYAADMGGSGAGAAALPLLLCLAPPEAVLSSLAAAGLLAAAIAWPRTAPGARRPRPVAPALVAAAVALAIASAFPWGRVAVEPSEYKGLSLALQAGGSRVVARSSGPLRRLDVVRNERSPFRLAPGMSLLSQEIPPEQLALFSDGELAGALAATDPKGAAYLAWTTSALPYGMLTSPRVLVAGLGGGEGVLQALHHGAASVAVADVDGQAIALLRGALRGFGGSLLDLPGVEALVADPRVLAASSSAAFDLIQLTLVDSPDPGAAGLRALSEGYVHTTEALAAYLGALAPGGLVSVTRWLHSPPRDELRLVSAAADARAMTGGGDPGASMAAIRGLRTFTLVFGKESLGEARLAALRDFSETNAFEIVFPRDPGGIRGQGNEGDLLAVAAETLLGAGRSAFERDYVFDIRPATDDRPYFDRYFRWRSLPLLASMPAASRTAQIEWGYVLVVATLAFSALASLPLVALPLLLARRRMAARPETTGPGGAARTITFFASIGFAYIAIEIGTIQRLTLLLGGRLYSFALALSSFLVFSGLGGAWSHRLESRRPLETKRRLEAAPDAAAVRAGAVESGGAPRAVAPVAAMAAAAIACLEALLAPSIQAAAAPWPAAARAALGVALVAPLAFAMGMPFPSMLSRIASSRPRLAPLAWAVNGCSSVVASALSALVAAEFGLRALSLGAAALYLAAAAVDRGWDPRYHRLSAPAATEEGRGGEAG